MKMKLKNRFAASDGEPTRRVFPLWLAASILSMTLLGCAFEDTAHDDELYTCPMHPTVIADKPGSCPVCGMDLVRKARAGEGVEMTDELSKLIRSPNESVVASIKTIRGQFKSIPVTLEAEGVITYDTRGIYTIAARVSGRLEKVYLKYPFQAVSQGQKIAEVYSPELITAQRELVFLLENDPENATLIAGAKRKLELLGMSHNQIAQLDRRREVSSTFSMYSPYTGYLITGQPTPPTSPSLPSPSGSGGEGMAMTPSSPGSKNANTVSADVIAREGQYVTAGETLFTVISSKALRIELDVPGSYSGMVKEGNAVELDFGGGLKTSSTIDLVQPYFGEGQNFLKLRIYPRNMEALPIGHLVKALIDVDSTEALWVPREAVLNLGTQDVVFVKDRGVLKPQVVSTGIRTGGMVAINSGLASSEEIAANAHYLIDSESFVKPIE